MSSSKDITNTTGHSPTILRPRDESKPTPAKVTMPNIPKLSGEEKRRMREELIGRPITPPSGPPPFAATLRHERGDLSEEAINDLEKHQVSRDLAKAIFSRWSADQPMLDGMARSVAIFGSDDEGSDGSVGSELSLKDTRKVEAAAVKSQVVRRQMMIPALEESPGKRDPPPVRLRMPSEELLPEIPPFSLSDDAEPYEDNDITPTGAAVGQVRPAPGASSPTTPTGKQPTDVEIEAILETMLARHRVEYERDILKIKQEEDLARSKAKGGTRNRPPIIHSGQTTPMTEELIRTVEIPRYGATRGGVAATSSDGVPDRPPKQNAPDNTPPHGEKPKWDGRAMTILSSIQNKDRDEIISDMIADHLNLRRGRRNSDSSPPVGPDGPGVVDRVSTFKTAPTGSSFVSIFTALIPPAGYRAPLSRLGRPLVPDSINCDKYTVVATYHPTYRHLVVDILDYCHTPAGFDSSLVVDLVYLQESGYLPSYLVWPPQDHGFKRYQVASQWSFVSTNANGTDHMYVSDLGVLSQRIAGSMFRAYECKEMSKAAHRRYLDSISEVCPDEIEVELVAKAAGLDSTPMYANVPTDYNVSASLNWRPLRNYPNHQLPHSRDGMPTKKFWFYR